MVGAFLIFLMCQLIGELAARVLGLPVPGPVLGAMLLFVALAVRGGPPEPVRALSRGLLQNLSVLFVPAGVGVIQHGGRLAEEGVAILAALIGSTLLTIAVAAAVFRIVSRLIGAEGGNP